jgi:hypothetical protein
MTLRLKFALMWGGIITLSAFTDVASFILSQRQVPDRALSERLTLLNL